MMSPLTSRSPGNECRWPDDLDPRTVCLSVDVDWAADAVLADVCRLFDERGLSATFFCTHAGIDVGKHERGLHPNYRRNGDRLKELRAQLGEKAATADETMVYRHVIGITRTFAPEAKGMRSHSLYYDSMMMPLYREFGIEYDSTYQIPLVSGLRPFWKEYDVLELPIYFADHFELKTGICGFDSTRLGLDQVGLKIINLHPNMIFLNCATEAQYQACKPFYHDVDRLASARHSGRGTRTLVLDLLDRIARDRLSTATLSEVNTRWRAAQGRATGEVAELALAGRSKDQ